jgi:hypothetical protein
LHDTGDYHARGGELYVGRQNVEGPRVVEYFFGAAEELSLRNMDVNAGLVQGKHRVSHKYKLVPYM